LNRSATTKEATVGLDETLDSILIGRKRRQCKTCAMVTAGLLADHWLVAAVERGGAPNVSRALSEYYPDADTPGSDAIRNHLANHVA